VGPSQSNNFTEAGVSLFGSTLSDSNRSTPVELPRRTFCAKK